MFRSCKFFCSAYDKKSFPSLGVPEIAFIGRSNVGKSSLINAITSNRHNARTSSSPGCTRKINFYLKEGHVALVDLPGYGYSKASKVEVQHYLEMIRYYLSSREALHRLVLLIDSKVGLKDIDIDFLEWVEACGVNCSIALTKSDKLSESKLRSMVSSVQDQVSNFCLVLNPIMVVSAKSGNGIKELACEISKCI